MNSSASTAYRDLDDFLKLDPKKMTYGEYLKWYARAKELQAQFSLPIIPLDMFQKAYADSSKPSNTSR